MDAVAIARALDDALASARALLARADAPVVRLAEWTMPRRVLGIARAARLSPTASAWHLGVLLLTSDDVFVVGEIVRAAEPGRRGFTAESQRRRSEIAAAARHGGFAEGEEVHVGWERVDPGALPAAVRVNGGVAQIRWAPSAGWVSLRSYADERATLLIDPPSGA